MICRLNQTTDTDANPCKIIQLIRDDGVSGDVLCSLSASFADRFQDEANCASCWSKDPVTHRPWLCLAGNDGNVKVYDVKLGKLVKVILPVYWMFDFGRANPQCRHSSVMAV